MDDDWFIYEILANPSDETVRLVYADWLDERNDPRGEWLRIQGQLERLAAEGGWDPTLVDRRRLLETTTDPDWLAAVRLRWHEGKPIRNWHHFYDSLAISPTYWPAVPKPTVVQLDQFEAETDFRLPRSYREYVLVFGPGKLLTDWNVAAPGYDPSWFWDLHAMQEHLRPMDHSIRYCRDADWDRLRRWRYFCSQYKDAFGWDPVEVCDPAASEYAVYRITANKEVVRVADSFREFVEETICEILSISDWDEEELGTRLCFEPATHQTIPLNKRRENNRTDGNRLTSSEMPEVRNKKHLLCSAWVSDPAAHSDRVESDSN